MKSVENLKEEKDNSNIHAYSEKDDIRESLYEESLDLEKINFDFSPSYYAEFLAETATK